jgi:hypothetical protein
MGCKVLGHLSINSSTNLGKVALAAHSEDNPLTCSSVGTSPVTNNQNKASGKGSFPPGAVGRAAWQSGMVIPRNRIPSSASRTEPSQIIPYGDRGDVQSELGIREQGLRMKSVTYLDSSHTTITKIPHIHTLNLSASWVLNTHVGLTHAWSTVTSPKDLWPWAARTALTC